MKRDHLFHPFALDLSLAVLSQCQSRWSKCSYSLFSVCVQRGWAAGWGGEALLLSPFLVFYLDRITEADLHVLGSECSPCSCYKKVIFRII